MQYNSPIVGPLSGDCMALKLNRLFLFVQEPRVPIRLLLLKVFGVLCGLDRTVIGILLASVLPNELGRDIQQDMKGVRMCLHVCMYVCLCECFIGGEERNRRRNNVCA